MVNREFPGTRPWIISPPSMIAVQELPGMPKVNKGIIAPPQRNYVSGGWYRLYTRLGGIVCCSTDAGISRGDCQGTKFLFNSGAVWTASASLLPKSASTKYSRAENFSDRLPRGAEKQISAIAPTMPPITCLPSLNCVRWFRIGCAPRC